MQQLETNVGRRWLKRTNWQSSIVWLQKCKEKHSVYQRHFLRYPSADFFQIFGWLPKFFGFAKVSREVENPANFRLTFTITAEIRLNDYNTSTELSKQVYRSFMAISNQQVTSCIGISKYYFQYFFGGFLADKKWRRIQLEAQAEGSNGTRLSLSSIGAWFVALCYRKLNHICPLLYVERHKSSNIIQPLRSILDNNFNAF